MEYAKRIKIKISYMEEDGRQRRIVLPKISFRFLGGILRLALPVIIRAKTGYTDQAIIEMIQSVIDVLSSMPPFELADIEVPDEKTIVKIYTC